MNILAMETTAAVASVAIMDADACIYEVVSEEGMTHLQNLIPLIDRALKECGHTLQDMEGIAVSRGPGSFTGIRIGMATAKGLAQALQIPIAEVPTLKALAMNAWDFDGLICPVLDARRNQVYAGTYRWQEDQITEEMAAGAYDIEQVIDAVAQEEAVLFMGDGLQNETVVQELTRKVAHRAFFAPPHRRTQRAETVAQLGREIFRQGGGVPYHAARPEYLRQSEAERKLACRK